MCDREMIPAVIVKRGDGDAGGVLIKINRLDSGCEVLSRVFDGDGNRAWMVVAGGTAASAEQHAQMEKASDSYIEREMDIDPDIWVVEIEDRNGAYVPDGEVIKS